MDIILASQSPRRQELMGLFHIPFQIRVADIDETMDDEYDPYDEVARVSRRKALAAAQTPDELVIAADTIVVCDGQILGKPHSPEHARQMLQLLSGRSHQVMTGLTVLRGNQIHSYTEVTDVYFRALSAQEISDYIASGDPMDKAGAYGIQNGAALFVEKIDGDYYNVVGLPVCRLHQMLTRIAPELF